MGYANTPFFKRVESNFNMAFRARSGYGVSAVYLQALGVTSANDINSLITSVTDQTAQNGLHHESYQQTVTLSGYTQAEDITLKAIIYPVVGDADSILDTSTNTTASNRILGLTEISCTCNKTSALKTYGVVTTTGNDTTGVSSATLATAEASPYLTVGAALEDGATDIYCRTGTHDVLGSAPSSVTALNYFREVRPHPDDTVSGIILDRSGAANNYGANKLTYIDFTGGITGNSHLSGQGAGNKILIFENCGMQSATLSGALGYASDGCWFVNCPSMGVDHFGDWAADVGYHFTGCTFDGNVSILPLYGMVACDSSVTSFEIQEPSSSTLPAPNNLMFEYNKLMDINAASNAVFRYGYISARNGLSVIGNILEASSGSQPCLAIGADTSIVDLKNVIAAHNTLAGQRGNLFYNDEGTTANVRENIWLVGNSLSAYYIKSDRFLHPVDGKQAGRIGNWAMMNGVHYRDNRMDGTIATELNGDYDGLNAAYVTARDAVFGQMGYVNDASGDGSGLGNGDYTPDTGSALIGHTLISPFITYDLFGNPVNSEIGAIQILVASSAEGRIIPSDTDNVAVLINDVYVGGTGDIKVTTAADDTVTFSSVPVGPFNPGCRIKKVFETGTTATNLIAAGST